MSRDVDTYDADFRSDWERTYRTSTGGYNYELYLPAYEYGYALATDKRYQGRQWDEIEVEARRDWEMQHPGDPWEEFKDAVQYAYERVRASERDSAE